MFDIIVRIRGRPRFCSVVGRSEGISGSNSHDVVFPFNASEENKLSTNCEPELMESSYPLTLR